MIDKSLLGNRITCFSCGTKFYDLNRDPALCPECGADQAEAPVRDMRAILKSGKRRKKKVVQEEVPAPKPAAADDDDDIDDVDDLFGDDQDEGKDADG